MRSLLGSFQMGAIECLYEVFGYRPDILAATSVGAINGFKLAEAPPPAVNDATAILAAVAAGTVDPQLKAMRELKQQWIDFLAPTDFFQVRPPFKGTMVEDVVRGINSPLFNGPVNVDLNKKLGFASFIIGNPHITYGAAGVLFTHPFLAFFLGPLFDSELKPIRTLIDNVFTENALLALDPVEGKLRDSTKVDPAKVAVGTPLFMGVVSLASGRLRYVKGDGAVVERDGVTPVASALSAADINNALDLNGAPLSAPLRQGITDALAAYAVQVSLIAAHKAAYNAEATTPSKRMDLIEQIDRAQVRGSLAHATLVARVAAARIAARVDPVVGVLASACLPIYFVPQAIGVELYVDGGIREILPMEVALSAGATEFIGILCSANELPVTDSMTRVGVLEVGLRAMLGISLKEIIEGDIASARSSGLPVRVVAPTFNVHDSVVVQESLIEISMHYGWMRASDELTSEIEAERVEFRAMSDHITLLRLKALGQERLIASTTEYLGLPVDPQLLADAVRHQYVRLRVLRWALSHVELARVARKLPRHPSGLNWSIDWEREHRGAMAPSGFASPWVELKLPGSTRAVLDASSPSTFRPNTDCIEDEASDAVFWLVRGAAFEDPDRDSSRGILVTLPPGVVKFLPKVPSGTHVISTRDNPAQHYLISGGKRYAVNDAQLAFAGQQGVTVATVPRNGHLQIPDGGVPFFLSELVAVDNLNRPLLGLDITCVEQTTRVLDVFVLNRSVPPRPLAIGGAQFVGLDPAAGASVTVVPQVVPANTIDIITVRAAPTMPGTFTGVLRIDCVDPQVPPVLLPVTLRAPAFGATAQLEFEPAAVQIDARLAHGSRAVVHVVNHGPVVPADVSFSVEPGPNAALFSLTALRPLPVAADFVPNARVELEVFFNPTELGARDGGIELRYGGTAASGAAYSRTTRLQVTGVGQASRIRLARVAPSIGNPQLGSTTLDVDVGVISGPTLNASQFFIGNIGNRDLKIGAIGINSLILKSPGVQKFPLIIAPSQWLPMSIDIGFAAAPGVGPFHGMLSIESDDPETPVATVTVHGVGAGSKGSIVPEFINFGAVAAGATETRKADLVNGGTVPLEVLDAVFMSPGVGFKLVSPLAFPVTVAPGQSLPLLVQFGPVNQADDYTDVLVLRVPDLLRAPRLGVQCRVQ
ncbi:patatin-like phospholipase family protein [Myxococcaceae bacterium GXIMD 01537]